MFGFSGLELAFPKMSSHTLPHTISFYKRQVRFVPNVVQDSRGVLDVGVLPLASCAVRALEFVKANRDRLLALQVLLLGAFLGRQRWPVFRCAKNLPSEHDNANKDREGD